MDPILDQALSYLESLPGSPDEATLVLKLKTRFPELEHKLLSIIIETHVGRRTAPERLGDWSKAGVFSKSLLEQASRESIARHRAEHFRGLQHVLEIGSGTGSDTAALAAVCDHVTTIDADPIASEIAQHNLSMRGVTNVTFVRGLAEQVIPTLRKLFDGLYADPARRTKDGVRVKEASDYLPSLDFLMSLEIGQVRALKVSPGLFIDPTSLEWTREFVGVGSECLEQTLWFGAGPGDLTASRVDEVMSWTPPDLVSPSLCAQSLEGYLLEPHATVNRTGKVAEFLHEYDAQPVAHDVPLGISEHVVSPNPLCSVFRILEAFPYQVKRLRSAAHARGWSNRTEVKKRNVPLEPEEIRSALKLAPHIHGAPYGVVFVLRWSGGLWVVLCERL